MKSYTSIDISKIKKVLQIRGYKISKKNKLVSENYKSLFHTSLASIFLVFFFYITPLTLNFISKIFSEKKIVLNESNKNFNRVLEGKEIESSEESDEVEFKDLYVDIFDINTSDQDTVRLSASTINQLFKDENYTLKDIRKNKLVKPIKIDLLPKDLKFFLHRLALIQKLHRVVICFLLMNLF